MHVLVRLSVIMRLRCKVVLEGMHSTVVSNLALVKAGSESAAHTAISLGIAHNTCVQLGKANSIQLITKIMKELLNSMEI